MESKFLLLFADRLESLRDLLGIPKGKFAKRVGISANSYSNYMRGRAPTLEVLLSIVDKFGVSGHWLLTGEGPMLSSADDGRVSREEYEKLQQEAERLRNDNVRALRLIADLSDKLSEASK